MKVIGIIFGIVVFVLVVIGISGCGSYNGIVSSNQTVDQQWAQVQNVYQRRADLIPNLVSTVQGSASFEKSTLESVIKARASATQVNVNAGTAPTDPAQFKQFEDAQGELSRSLGRLLVTVEAYPDLKSSRNFLELQSQLEGTENRISVERGNFNAAVQDYNTRVQRFPGVVVARLGGFMPRPYFAAAPESQTAPKVDFNFGNAPKVPAAQ